MGERLLGWERTSTNEHEQEHEHEQESLAALADLPFRQSCSVADRGRGVGEEQREGAPAPDGVERNIQAAGEG
jgi:hypothetical protein